MNASGYFGEFGGAYVSEPLFPAIVELQTAFAEILSDASFAAELAALLENYAGRPTPLYPALNLSRAWGAAIYLKREDLLHGGAHKTNNAIGQALLAKKLGKKRIIAETGAGQHGVATAMAGAMLGLETVIYMGSTDVERQYQNVQRIRLLGAELVEVQDGSRTLKDAINAALRDWVANVRDTHYLIGTAAGPHPFPSLVKHFQKVIGLETREQILRQTGRLPCSVVACVGGGSNAIGMFSGFIEDESVSLIGVEPAGEGLDSGRHGAVLARGTTGCLHGMISKVIQDESGQILPTHSIAAGLDYPSVGPEHAYLSQKGRARYTSVCDSEAVEAYHELARTEGIIPALESAHALAGAKKIAAQGRQRSIVVCLSGRGDKDMELVQEYGFRKSCLQERSTDNVFC